MNAPAPATIYKIDDRDRVVEVNDEFWSFAAANDWTPDNDSILGKSIWSFIKGDGATLYFRYLVEQVRKTKQAFCYPFRCDSLDCREMTMTIAPGAGNPWFLFPNWTATCICMTPYHHHGEDRPTCCARCAGASNATVAGYRCAARFPIVSWRLAHALSISTTALIAVRWNGRKRNSARTCTRPTAENATPTRCTANTLPARCTPACIAASGF